MRAFLSCRPKPLDLSKMPLKEVGQSAVEIALLLPILLFLLSGIIIVTLNFFAFIQVSNAAREGARAGSLYRLTMNNGSGVTLDTTVKNAIYNANGTLTPNDDVSALGFLSTSASSFNVATDVVCTLNGSACGTFTLNNPPQAGDQLEVRVTYHYTMPVVSQALPMFPQPLVIVRTVVMGVQ
jgi:Flp pilus assembly protein TadG